MCRGVAVFWVSLLVVGAIVHAKVDNDSMNKWSRGHDDEDMWRCTDDGRGGSTCKWDPVGVLREVKAELVALTIRQQEEALAMEACQRQIEQLSADIERQAIEVDRLVVDLLQNVPLPLLCAEPRLAKWQPFTELCKDLV